VKLQTLLDSPVVAIGTLDEVCEKVTRVRDELGFSYFVVPYGSAPQSLEPIVARLARVPDYLMCCGGPLAHRGKVSISFREEKGVVEPLSATALSKTSLLWLPS
jgi:hypothetical protein